VPRSSGLDDSGRVAASASKRPTGSGLAIAFIRGYQILLAPVMGGACRFTPSCSAYAIEAIERHGARRGMWLAMRRIARCHPWGGAGFDPVPARTDESVERHRQR
jgi:putative membrane protein insertion efficiency factor